MMIDYRKMLIAYMNLVGECEGIDFLGYDAQDALEGLTEEEAVELAKIRDLGRWPDRPREGYRRSVYYNPDGTKI